jgi:hypothetical protein
VERVPTRFRGREPARSGGNSEKRPTLGVL